MGLQRGRESSDVFKKGKFELLALNETNMKKNREISWYGASGASMQDYKRMIGLGKLWQFAE